MHVRKPRQSTKTRLTSDHHCTHQHVMTSSLQGPVYIQPEKNVFKFEQNVFHFYCWHEKLISAMWRQRLVFH